MLSRYEKVWIIRILNFSLDCLAVCKYMVNELGRILNADLFDSFVKFDKDSSVAVVLQLNINEVPFRIHENVFGS
jgi:hypothetical protein